MPPTPTVRRSTSPRFPPATLSADIATLSTPGKPQLAIPTSAYSRSQSRGRHLDNQPGDSSLSQSATTTQPSSFFSAASLPRTSSLLPPPRPLPSDAHPVLGPPAFRDPFNAEPISSHDRQVSETDQVYSKRWPSRSSSVSGLAEGLRGLDRWSASTASSRGTNRRKSSSFSHRMSVDAVALQNSINPTVITYQTPRKLQKSRPSTANGGSPGGAVGGSRAYPPSPSRVPPLASLPPILSLPSLEQEVRGGYPSLSNRPTPQQRPPYLRQQSGDYASYFGNDRAETPGESISSTKVERPVSPGSQVATDRDVDMLPYEQGDGVGGRPRGHSRNRSQNAKSSGDSTKSRDRSKQPSQKAMLSKALQKANTAVQLDNAGNVEGARSAYSEACDLLQQVLSRTSGEEDKRKLEAIVSDSKTLDDGSTVID